MERQNEMLIPVPLIMISSLLGLLALSGLSGGYTLLSDTTGQSLGFSSQMIDKIPLINNYLLPALIIFLVFGIAPTITLYGLINFNTDRSWCKRKSKYHWAWQSTRVISLILMVWIVVQTLIIGYLHPIHLVFGICGLILYGLVSMWSVRQIYELK